MCSANNAVTANPHQISTQTNPGRHCRTPETGTSGCVREGSHSWPESTASVAERQMWLASVLQDIHPNAEERVEHTAIDISLLDIQTRAKPPLQLQLNTLFRHAHQVHRSQNISDLVQERVISRQTRQFHHLHIRRGRALGQHRIARGDGQTGGIVVAVMISTGTGEIKLGHRARMRRKVSATVGGMCGVGRGHGMP